MKLTYLAIILLVFLLGLTTNSFILSTIENNQEIVINTTEITLDLNETNRLLKENRILLEKVNDKDVNCVAEFNVPRIQFYPRNQRECRNPIEKTIYGSSMQPFLYKGDVYYVEKVRFNDIELGDVIVYGDKEESTIHSVTAIYEEYIITAGYNNLYEDYAVYPEEILYRYCIK